MALHQLLAPKLMLPVLLRGLLLRMVPQAVWAELLAARVLKV